MNGTRTHGTFFIQYVQEAFRGGVTAADRREQSASLESEYVNTYIHTRLCAAGIDQSTLVKYVLKDLGSKLLSILVQVQAQTSYVHCPVGEMITAERKAVVALIPVGPRASLVKLEALLVSKTADAFLDALEDTAELLGFRWGFWSTLLVDVFHTHESRSLFHSDSPCTENFLAKIILPVHDHTSLLDLSTELTASSTRFVSRVLH
jgi:hypothetical protein